MSNFYLYFCGAVLLGYNFLRNNYVTSLLCISSFVQCLYILIIIYFITDVALVLRNLMNGDNKEGKYLHTASELDP